MPYSAKQKTEIRRAVELLSHVTRKGNVDEPSSMLEAQRQFRTLRDEMAHSEQPSVVLLASLGERLAGHLCKETALGSSTLRKLVAEIAGHIAKEVTLPAEPKGGAAKTTLKARTGDQRLSLRDGKRLGELLVKMAMLTPEQVEEAVKVQRDTGQRLGEALLQMRLLTPDMLESALRLQKTRRAASDRGDLWSFYDRPTV